MMEPVYVGIDVGTQSVRALAATADGEVVASATEKLPAGKRVDTQHEQNPETWWAAVCVCLGNVSHQLGPGRCVEGLCVDATSGTILLADQEHRPLTPGLMYDDGRAVVEADEVNAAGKELWTELSYKMQPSWALPKLQWLLRHTSVPTGARLAHQNDFINARLAGEWLPADSSHALKTGYDQLRRRWPTEILERLRVSPEVLPHVVPPGTEIGTIGRIGAQQTGLSMGVPIYAGMTDGCAAQIASGATATGSWNSVIGTTLVVKGVTRDLLRDPRGVVYSHRSIDGLWLPGGASSTGAAAIAKEFEGSDLASLNEAALSAGPTSQVVYPLVGKGERFPFAEPQAEGFSIGTSYGKVDRYRGVLQGIAMVERLAFDRLTELGAETSGRFTISGGAVNSEALNQLRADMLQRELLMPAVTEGAFGMAILAAAAQTTLQSAVGRMVRVVRTISPRRPFSDYAEQYGRFLSELQQRGWLVQSPVEVAVES